METPDITTAQSTAVAGLIAALIGAYAAGITGTEFIVLAACGTLLACVVIIADAAIRRGRAAAFLRADDGEDAQVLMFPAQPDEGA